MQDRYFGGLEASVSQAHIGPSSCSIFDQPNGPRERKKAEAHGAFSQE